MKFSAWMKAFIFVLLNLNNQTDVEMATIPELTEERLREMLLGVQALIGSAARAGAQDAATPSMGNETFKAFLWA